jgi:hypothetical protein
MLFVYQYKYTTKDTIKMPQLIKNQYEKLGAVFASGEEAFADKNSLFTPELYSTMNENELISLGILLEPYHFEWDQDTFTLTVNKLVSSEVAYNENRTTDSATAFDLANQAGWTYLGKIVTEVE